MNSLVLSDAQRASVTDPVIRKLIELIPRANFVDSSGTPRFIGWAGAPVDQGQWTGDLSYNIARSDHLHFYYDFFFLLMQIDFFFLETILFFDR